MRLSCAVLPLLVGCASTSSYVKSSDTALGRVVVYRNGLAYFERSALVDSEELRLTVPPDKVDDFLKSLTVSDAQTGARAPVSFPSDPSASGSTEMRIHLLGKRPHRLKLTYVTEAPAWKPSYRIVLGKQGKVELQGWAIIDNTSGEDWKNVKLGVGSSSALSFRFDLRSVRSVARETLRSDDQFAQAPPLGDSSYAPFVEPVLSELPESAVAQLEPGAPAEPSAPPEPAEENLGPAEAAPAEPASPEPLAAAAELELAPESEAAPKAPVASASEEPTVDIASSSTGKSINREFSRRASLTENRRETTRKGRSSYKNLANLLRSTDRSVVVEGFADPTDKNKLGASLERAERVRAELISLGVNPKRVTTAGRGSQPGRAGGVRIIDAPDAQAPTPPRRPQKLDAGAEARTLEPIGTSHFESRSAMTVPPGQLCDGFDHQRRDRWRHRLSV